MSHTGGFLWIQSRISQERKAFGNAMSHRFDVVNGCHVTRGCAEDAPVDDEDVVATVTDVSW
jgi:hypothetical protein